MWACGSSGFQGRLAKLVLNPGGQVEPRPLCLDFPEAIANLIRVIIPLISLMLCHHLCRASATLPLHLRIRIRAFQPGFALSSIEPPSRQPPPPPSQRLRFACERKQKPFQTDYFPEGEPVVRTSHYTFSLQPGCLTVSGTRRRSNAC